MRKNELRIYIPVLVLMLLAAGVYFLLNGYSEDKQPPTITVAADPLPISVADPEETLLQGVSAYDEQDGDVTDLLLIESISAITEDHTATVTYAAFDQSGNVSKITRSLQYTDYTSPVFDLKSPLVFQVSSNTDVLSRVVVTDALDGDISRNLKAVLAGESTGLNNVGTHQVAFRVTNSMGDTARITLPVDILPSNTYQGKLQLSRNLIYLKQGAVFSARDYVQSMSMGGTTVSLSDGVQLEIRSDVNTAVPGVYSVAYTARYNTTQAFTRLIVVVE